MTQFNFGNVDFVQPVDINMLHVLDKEHIGFKFTTKPDGVPGKYEINHYAFDEEQMLDLAAMLVSHIRREFRDKQIPEHLYSQARRLLYPNEYNEIGELIKQPCPPNPQYPTPDNLPDEPMVVPAAPPPQS
jgi:hypothetical protein